MGFSGWGPAVRLIRLSSCGTTRPLGFVMQADWWEVPFGRVNAVAVLAGTIVPMLMHPAELLAAAVWFSLITWLMVRTKNLWDCIAAHAVTNLLLGVYVVLSGQWHLM
jgi:membrane protease YdiL (CAAX protease family)